MSIVVIQAGTVFGRVTVLGYAETIKDTRYLSVKCSCGTRLTVAHGNLISGNTTSCGCSRKKHGMAKSRTYAIWEGVKARCLNTNNRQFRTYGGRGIKLDPKWHSFAGFLADMGECPDGLSIDRINNDGNYEPGNCRWTTLAVQAQNMRRNQWVVLNGKQMILYDATRRLGIGNSSPYWRAKHHGVTLQEALDYYAEKAVRHRAHVAA